MNERFAFDAARAGAGRLAGADEAGRGCLAGPLVAAAVCFDYGSLDAGDFLALDALHDSKRLSVKRREVLYAEVLRRAQRVVVVCCSPGTIDRKGLHRCNLASLAAAVEGVRPAAATTLIDGFRLPECAVPHEAVVGGDGLSAAIAAASIIAKVTRDRVMQRLHDEHPVYGFDRHVGYATKAHQLAIIEHGVCSQHRLSFASVAYQQLGLPVGGEPPAT